MQRSFGAKLRVPVGLQRNEKVGDIICHHCHFWNRSFDEIIEENLTKGPRALNPEPRL